jgi:chromosome segregation ATPase
MERVEQCLAAALTGRLSKLVKEMSEQTQLIVIAHSKRTMHAAQAL